MKIDLNNVCYTFDGVDYTIDKLTVLEGKVFDLKEFCKDIFLNGNAFIIDFEKCFLYVTADKNMRYSAIRINKHTEKVENFNSTIQYIIDMGPLREISMDYLLENIYIGEEIVC